MKIDERKKIKAEAKSKVSEVLAQEDQAKMQAKLDELFNDVLTELAESKADKDKVVEDNTRLTETLENLKSERETLEKAKEELEVTAEDLQKKLEAADQKITSLEAEFDKITKEAALRARVTELEEAGLMSSGKAADRLMQRIKEMDDTAFADYKTELVELKSAWVKLAVEEAAGAREEKAEDLPDEETKKSTAASLKIKKATAAINVPSSVDESAYITPDASLTKAYETMWNEEVI
jgi:DNA repair exonuclease SbcCD ATPase subunit